MKALEKRADMRYPTMDEFMRAMSDPVGYVEAHGGVGAFLQRQLMPSNAPMHDVGAADASAAAHPATRDADRAAPRHAGAHDARIVGGATEAAGRDREVGQASDDRRVRGHGARHRPRHRVHR